MYTPLMADAGSSRAKGPGAGGGRSVTIVGAGLAGSLLAIYLARQGMRVRVFERRPDPRAKGYAGGRSINLALSVRGLWGLAGVGLDKVVMAQDAVAMRGRMLHPITPPPGGAALPFQAYSSNPHDAINSVSRGGLNLTLLNAAAAEPNVDLHFEQRCVDIDPDSGTAVFQAEAIAAARGLSLAVSGPTTSVRSDLILGADGAFSAVRQRLIKIDRFEYAQSYLGHGYKELHIPPAAGPGGDGGTRTPDGLERERYRLEPHALHIWPRGASMMIALPNRDGSFTCTLFWPFEGEHSFANLRTDEEVREFFSSQYADAVPLMPTLVEDYRRNPVSSLVTVRTWPWSHVSDSGHAAAVLGDAAHAIVPFYGQGMNCAFEDVRVLAELLARDPGDIRGVLGEFERSRKPDAEAIADMAIENFEEMRDKTARADFLYKKRVEQTVHEMFPDRATPQYNLVSFSTVPYARARALGREFDRIVAQVVGSVPAPAGQIVDPMWRDRVRLAASEAFAAADRAKG